MEESPHNIVPEFNLWLFVQSVSKLYKKLNSNDFLLI